MGMISSNTPGGITLRRLLPIAVLIPIVLGWLSRRGELAGFYDTTFEIVVVVLFMVVLLTFTIWLNADMLNHSDLGRQQAEERFRLVVEAAPVAMIMVDERGKIQIANSHTREMFGYQSEELIGKSVELLVPERLRPKHPGFRQSYFAEPQARAMGVGRDLFGLRKDGEEIPVEIGLNPMQTADELFILAAIIDITERKKNEVEMKRSIDELARSNAELEQFAYVASHDLQEPLRMVSSYMQLLARRYQGKLDKDADEFIAFAVDGAGRMKTLINDLLTFSRVGTRGKELVPIKLDDVFNRAIHTMEVTLEESDAQITHDPLPQVLADEGQMLQLFQNLLGNALKFRGDATPKVHVGARRDKDRWLLYVRDNGIGIDPQFWERIFVIFQRLHNREEYEGTGIGLAICRKIVERHGGHIWVESEPGKGSTFYFTLTPVEATSTPEQKQETSTEPAKMARQTIADRADDLI
jgi:PAS domain S-box-containing protein